MNVLAAALSILFSGWPSCCSQGSACVPAIMDANSGDVASSNMVRLRAVHRIQTTFHTYIHMSFPCLPRMAALPCMLPAHCLGAGRSGHEVASSGANCLLRLAAS